MGIIERVKRFTEGSVVFLYRWLGRELRHGLFGLWMAAVLLLFLGMPLECIAGPTVLGSVEIDPTEVNMGYGPPGIAVDSGIDRVYVNRYTHVGNSEIRVVDVSIPASPTVVTSITGNAAGVAVNPVTHRLYTTDGYGGNIRVYDGITNTLLATVHKGYCHPAIDVDATTNLIYFFSQCGALNDPVSVLDGGTNTLVAGPLGSGGVAVNLRVNPTTHRVYSGTAYDIALAHTRVFGPGPTFSFETDLTDPSGMRIAGVNPTTNRLYFRSGSDIKVLDGSTHAFIATISGTSSTAADLLGVNESSNRLYQTDNPGGNVHIIDGSTNTVVGAFSLGPGVVPISFAIVDSIKHHVYVAGHVAGTTRLYIVEDLPEPTPPSGVTCGGVPATIVGTAGDDNIKGTSGPDVIAGLGGNDKIKGKGGDDVICGGSGNDNLNGGDGDDAVYGEDGDDRIKGGSGDDTLYGGAGNDRMSGRDGNDTMDGGAGEDRMSGGSGDDRLIGGLDRDHVSGRAGADTLVISAGDVPAGVMEKQSGGSDTDTLELGVGIGVDDITSGTVPRTIIVTDPTSGGTYKVRKVESVTNP